MNLFTERMVKIANIYWKLGYNEKDKNDEYGGKDMKKGEFIKSGITMGSALAMVISWSLNESVIWAIIHGIFSWVYVLYYLIILN